MFDLVGQQIADNRKKIGLTVLHRPGGRWLPVEVARLTNGLSTEASGHPQHPEHLILLGYHTKDKTLRALLGGAAYTASQATGQDNPELPFNPHFI